MYHLYILELILIRKRLLLTTNWITHQKERASILMITHDLDHIARMQQIDEISQGVD